MPLPDIIGGGSDVPAFDENKLLSPVQLKAALIALSIKHILTEIPSDTVNLLAFNVRQHRCLWVDVWFLAQSASGDGWIDGDFPVSLSHFLRGMTHLSSSTINSHHLL